MGFTGGSGFNGRAGLVGLTGSAGLVVDVDKASSAILRAVVAEVTAALRAFVAALFWSGEVAADIAVTKSLKAFCMTVLKFASMAKRFASRADLGVPPLSRTALTAVS